MNYKELEEELSNAQEDTRSALESLREMTAERDALAKELVNTQEDYAPSFEGLHAMTAERDAALAELAALQKKIYDSPHGTLTYLHQLIVRVYCGLPDTKVFALVLLDNATTDNATVEEQSP